MKWEKNVMYKCLYISELYGDKNFAVLQLSDPISKSLAKRYAIIAVEYTIEVLNKLNSESVDVKDELLVQQEILNKLIQTYDTK